ncbi:YbbR-like domain-containing protein [Paenisporosarcina sp. TG20]|uniref:CdaR family protein n=1 Tax=Paenisporosarcina sp. TG20 TaxID=1211706 RepID=UPI0002DE2080|nr:CdaR family protein [Paenisporosarcina sp. TG20]
MDKLMDSPWFLRITALLLAMLLFFTVKSDEQNLNAGTGNMTDVIRDVPVEVYYDDENLVLTGVPKTVDMTIIGPTSLVQTAKQLQDFTVFVDLRNLNMGEHEVEPQVENLSDKLQVRFEPAFIKVNIEERITRELRVEPEINTRLLADNFIVTSMKSDPERIQITGAKSVIESISFVKATVAGDQGLNETFTQEASVKVLDKDLSKLNVTIEPALVNVTIEIEEYSQEVPISLRRIGTPKEGVTINSLTPSFTNVRVFGKQTVVDSLREIVVDVDVSKIDDSESLTLEIPLPEGVSRMSESEVEVDADVVLAVEEEAVPDDSTQTDSAIRVFADVNVEVRGLNETDQYSFIRPESGQLVLTIQGEDQFLSTLSTSDFQVYVDARDAKIGENLFEVIVQGPDNVTWKVSTPSVTVDVLRA